MIPSTAQRGSFATYKYREIPYAIYFDVTRLSWCTAVPNGKLVCGVSNATEAMLLGRRIIEELKKPPQKILPRRSVPTPSAPFSVEHQRFAAKRHGEIMIAQALERARKEIRRLDNPELFTRYDLPFSYKTLNRLEAMGYVRRAGTLSLRFDKDRQALRTKAKQRTAFTLTPAGKQWVDADADEGPPASENPASENPIQGPWLVAGGVALGVLGVVALTFAGRSQPGAAPTCTSWKFPTFAELPKDVVARSTELQHDMSKPIGFQTVEIWHEKTYRFNVRIHPANSIVGVPHRGADVEICFA